MQALLLLIASLLSSGADQATIDATLATQSGYTATYDATTGDATVTNPDGSIVVIDPDEAN